MKYTQLCKIMKFVETADIGKPHLAAIGGYVIELNQRMRIMPGPTLTDFVMNFVMLVKQTEK